MESIFPGIPKESVKVAHDPAIPSTWAVTCKYDGKAYLMVFEHHAENGTLSQYRIFVADTEYFSSGDEVKFARMAEDPTKKFIRTLFEAE